MILSAALLLGIGGLLLAWSHQLFLASSSPVVTAVAIVVLCLGIAFAGAGGAVGIRALKDL